MAKPHRGLRAAAAVTACLACMAVELALSGDWPQYMRDAAHTGDAQDEDISTNGLGLEAQIQLGDAILSSPAVVGGRTYLVDQMGTAYSIDWNRRDITWKASPEGRKAKGSNTSSPCVAGGRMYYGTTAGNFIILDAASGAVVKMVDLGWPMTSPPVVADDSVYIQTLGAVLYCFDLNGVERWRWDHYRRYTVPENEVAAQAKHHTIEYFNAPMHGGFDVAVSGHRVVTTFGWDLLFLDDLKTNASLAWCKRGLLGIDDGTPYNSTISANGYVYTGWPGVDGKGNLTRIRLSDGAWTNNETGYAGVHAAVGLLYNAPASRGDQVYYGSSGVTGIHQVPANKTFSGRHGPSVVGSPVLCRNYVVFGTGDGQLCLVSTAATGSEWNRLDPQPYCFKTPGGKMIASAPAISQGHIFFGSDDGFLYVLGTGGTLVPNTNLPALYERKSQTISATGIRSDWPVSYGSPNNSCNVRDALFRPPVRLRWAAKTYFTHEAPFCCTADDAVETSMDGWITCLEQSTGRLRWRRHLGQGLFIGPTFADHRFFTMTYNALWCLGEATGETLWSAPGGNSEWVSRRGPIYINGLVLFNYGARGALSNSVMCSVGIVEAREARTGESKWKYQMGVPMPAWDCNPKGCVAGDDLVIYTAGNNTRGRQYGQGETVALQASTGRVIWRRHDKHGGTRSVPTATGGRVFIYTEYAPMYCLSVTNGEVLWQTRENVMLMNALAVDTHQGTITGRGYGSRGYTWNISDGQVTTNANGQPLALGSTPGKSCGSVLLTDGGLCIAADVRGIYFSDKTTGACITNTLGFPPRACVGPSFANGRLFLPTHASGMFYCYEPDAGVDH